MSTPSSKRGGPALLLGVAFAILVVQGILLLRPATEGGDTRGQAPATSASTPEEGAPILEGRGEEEDPIEAEAAATPSGDQPLLPPWPVGEPARHAPGAGDVYILLVDGRGEPLANHPIEVSWWLRFGVSGGDEGRTDDAGRFRTTATAPWQVESVGVPTAAEPRNVQLYHPGPFAAHPERPNEVRVEVPLPGLIRGHITDLDGTPLPGAVSCRSARLLHLDPFTFRMGIDDRTATVGGDGRFALPVVVGHYTLSVEGATSAANITIDAQHPVVDTRFVIPRPSRRGSLEVHVLGVPAEAQPKIRVGARIDEPVFGIPGDTSGVTHRARPLFVRPVRLESDRFRFDGLVGTGWRVSVSAPGMQARVVGVDEGQSTLDVTLEAAEEKRVPMVRILGRLPDGKTVRPHIDRRFSVEGGVHSDHGSWFGPDDAPQEGTPVELFSDKPTWLLLSYPNMAYVGVGPIPRDTKLPRIEVPFEPAGEAVVTLVNREGQPLACTVTLFPTWRFFREPQPSGGTQPGTRPGHAPVGADVHRQSNDDGHASFGWIGSAPLAVQAVPKDPAFPPARGEVRAGEHRTLVCGEGVEPRVALDVHVLEAQSGAPIPGVSVRVYAERAPSTEDQPEGETDAEGRLRLEGLVAGPTHVYIQARGFATPPTRVQDTGALDGPLEYRLHRTRHLPVRILAADGSPVDNAELRARLPGGELVTLQDEYGNHDGEEVWTDASGRANMAGLPALRVSLEVARAGSEAFASFEVDLRVPPTNLLTLTLK